MNLSFMRTTKPYNYIMLKCIKAILNYFEEQEMFKE